MQKFNSIMPVPIGREWEGQGLSMVVKIISKEKKPTSLSSVEWWKHEIIKMAMMYKIIDYSQGNCI